MITRDYQTLLINLLGEDVVADTDLQIFVKLLATSLAEYVTKIDNLPSLVDIDLVDSEYLTYLQKQFALKLPDSSTFDSREFLRESKAWYSGKGTNNLYKFIGTITNTSLSTFETSKLVLRTSNPGTRLSGTFSNGAKLPYEQSKLGRIRDGILWAYFVYILRVQGAQYVSSLSDLFTIIKLNHTAGSQFFSEIDFYWKTDNQPVTIMQLLDVSIYYVSNEYQTSIVSNSQDIVQIASYLQSYRSVESSRLTNIYSDVDL